MDCSRSKVSGNETDLEYEVEHRDLRVESAYETGKPTARQYDRKVHVLRDNENDPLGKAIDGSRPPNLNGDLERKVNRQQRHHQQPEQRPQKLTEHRREQLPEYANEHLPQHRGEPMEYRREQLPQQRREQHLEHRKEQVPERGSEQLPRHRREQLHQHRREQLSDYPKEHLSQQQREQLSELRKKQIPEQGSEELFQHQREPLGEYPMECLPQHQKEQLSRYRREQTSQYRRERLPGHRNEQYSVHLRDNLPQNRNELLQEYRKEHFSEHLKVELPEKLRLELQEQRRHTEKERDQSRQKSRPKLDPNTEFHRRNDALGELLRNSVVVHSDCVKDNLNRLAAPTLLRPISGHRQASGRGGCSGCDSKKYAQHPDRYEPTCCDARDTSNANHMCNECYDNPRPPKPRRNKSRNANYNNQDNFRRQCDCDDEPQTRSRPEPRAYDVYCQECAQAPQPRSQSDYRGRSYSYEPPTRPHRTKPRKTQSVCPCDSKSSYKGYAPSNRNSHYMEVSEFRNIVCRNPLVVKSRGCINPCEEEKPKPKTYVPCPNYNDVPQSVNNDCCTTGRSRQKVRTRAVIERPPRQYDCDPCNSNPPTDYMEFERDQCNQYPAKRNCSNERLCCPRKPPPRSEKLKPKCVSAPAPRKCPPPCIKTPQQRSVKVNRTCYVPPSCFAPRFANTSRKCSGSDIHFTDKCVSTLTQGNRRKIHIKSPDTLGAVPQMRRTKSNLKERLSGRGLTYPRIQDVFSSKMFLGTGCNMVPMPTLSKMNRRVPKLKPCSITPFRCRGGKLSNTTTPVPKTRGNNINSMSTARTTPQRGTGGGRRDLTQSTRGTPTLARRDLPKRNQVTPTIIAIRPIPVTEERGRPAARPASILHHPAPEAQTKPNTTAAASQGKATTTKGASARDSVRVSTVPQPAPRIKKSVVIQEKVDHERSSFANEKREAPRPSQQQSVRNSGNRVETESGRVTTPSQRQRDGTYAMTKHAAPNQFHHQGSVRFNEAAGTAVQETAKPVAQEAERLTSQKATKTSTHKLTRPLTEQASRSPLPTTSRSQADPRSITPQQVHEVRSSTPAQTPDRERSLNITHEADEKPQHSRPIKDEGEARQDPNYRYYRGSFLTIRPNIPNEESIRASRKRGSLIMITQNGMQKSLAKGSSYIAPQWQCLGKKGGSHATNSFVDATKEGPQRNQFSWRKFVPHWLVNDKHRRTDV
ncbi:uncharacterized protein LOC133841605 [Drosophila sulfurigaster albostrigata]|uniref:uncharacterized protein LOC133841605 n=1 Tax=Drosophila sulfurigaster albostrigata TaxID=89887 RepID=UPI002D219D05|nr:uncharacterized protein LOC133841605 [Drosophila sulfurigaster albostrigata]